MKGVIFTEFLDMVEEKFSLEMVDQIIEGSDLPSGGAYTAVGTYDHREIFTLIVQLHKATAIPISDLMTVYGEHLFTRFVKGYPDFFKRVDGAFSFLESVHGYIHKEVLKLYPDAELPAFETERVDESTLTMLYRSQRRMAPFGLGLIKGCMDHFKEPADIDMKSLDDSGTEVLFTIRKI